MNDEGEKSKGMRREGIVVMTESLPAGTVITTAGMRAIHRQFHAQKKRLIPEAHALHILAEYNPKPIPTHE